MTKGRLARYQVLEQDANEYVLGVLAASSLEDLIQYHDPQFIDCIETRARQDPSFRHLLGGVYESSTPDVWFRIETARGRPW